VIDKKTVFVLGAGASCPYGYPSGARLRELICHPEEFVNYKHLWNSVQNISEVQVKQFKDAFEKSSIKSIDIFMANNPKLAPVGKYIIAFEVFRAESQSCFGEKAKLQQEELAYAINHGKFVPRKLLLITLFQGGDWYFYLYNRLIEGLVGPNALPDFSDGKIAFITFNYDRSLEHFLYESLRNSFTEVSEDRIIQSLSQLKILHVYGQIAPLKWQNPSDYVDYKPLLSESFLQNTANNIRTIYEQKESPELNEARQLLAQAEQIFFLGFGYAEENLEILKLSDRTKRTSWIYGTAFGLENGELNDYRNKIIEWLPVDSSQRVRVENMDCLKLLRNYF